MTEGESLALFEAREEWADLWAEVGMPEFVQEDKSPDCALKVFFRSEADKQKFLDLVGPTPVHRESIWYPPKDEQDYFSYSDALRVEVHPNKYPVYVITKGRWENPLTIRSLEQLGLHHYVVVEPQEREQYETVCGPASEIRVLPFSNLGQGSIPARNWCWEDSIKRGAKRHWILDDNLRGFFRLNRNVKHQIVDENPFTDMERFTDYFKNVGISGPHYQWFIQSRTKTKPFVRNTRVYSCILIDNSLRFRWRGRYNEDTDLCIRTLKAGFATILFHSHLIGKAATMTMKGGNTDELYAGDGRLEMAQSLVDQHPDCTKIVEKWGRYQHHVDYYPFRNNPLIRADDPQPWAPQYPLIEEDGLLPPPSDPPAKWMTGGTINV